jgi:hypothetical protein
MSSCCDFLKFPVACFPGDFAYQNFVCILIQSNVSILILLWYVVYDILPLYQQACTLIITVSEDAEEGFSVS